MKNLLTRDEFREAVFARDNHKCVICGEDAADAHHIIERKLFHDGGYYLDNGASLCSKHHLEAEMTTISCEEIRKACGIENVVLPLNYAPNFKYDKWGNIQLHNGNRIKGDFFYEEAVQKILGQADLLHLFTKHIKYPRTYHLPWSHGTSDDKVLSDDSIFHNKEVVVTLKMDGECLSASTKIKMADGTSKQISKLVNNNLVGQYVLGKDCSGNIVKSKILNVFKNGRTDNWKKVYIRTPNGGNSRVIYCTPNHKFITTDNNEIKASDLIPNQKVFFIKKETSLTNTQKEVILGKLLGDGSLHLHHGITANVQFSHKKSHIQYSEYTNKWLGNITKNKTCEYCSGYGSKMLKSWTITTNSIYNEFCDMVENGTKVVTEKYINIATPLTIAFWYMDDGTRTHNDKQRDRVTFSVCGFDKKSCINLQSILNKFNIKSSVKIYSGYRYIVLNADNSEKLFDLVSKYIPPVMEYKLPSSYRNNTKVSPFDNIALERYYTVDAVIEKIEDKPHRVDRIKYDIETETHNYFANGVLVHNCTTMYDDHIHARSLDSSKHESRTLVKQLHAQIKYELAENWRICGENMYAVHSIEYTDLPSVFLMFSFWIDHICLSWDETVAYAEMLGLETVPVIYRGQYDKDAIIAAFEPYLEKHEGYVIRLAESFPYMSFKESLAKYVRPEFKQMIDESEGHWMTKKVIPNGFSK
jgi:hypothetical protein